MDACVQTEEKLQTEPQKQQHTCSFAHKQLFLCQIWSNLMTQIDTSRIARFKPSPARCPCLNKAWACSKFCGCAQKQVCECECVFAALWLHHSRKSAGRWGEFSRKALTDLVVSILRQKAIARLHLFHWTSTMKKKKEKEKRTCSCITANRCTQTTKTDVSQNGILKKNVGFNRKRNSQFAFSLLYI